MKAARIHQGEPRAVVCGRVATIGEASRHLGGSSQAGGSCEAPPTSGTGSTFLSLSASVPFAVSKRATLIPAHRRTVQIVVRRFTLYSASCPCEAAHFPPSSTNPKHEPTVEGRLQSRGRSTGEGASRTRDTQYPPGPLGDRNRTRRASARSCSRPRSQRCRRSARLADGSVDTCSQTSAVPFPS